MLVTCGAGPPPRIRPVANLARCKSAAGRTRCGELCAHFLDLRCLFFHGCCKTRNRGENETGCRRRDVDNKELSTTGVTPFAITEQ